MNNAYRRIPNFPILTDRTTRLDTTFSPSNIRQVAGRATLLFAQTREPKLNRNTKAATTAASIYCSPRITYYETLFTPDPCCSVIRTDTKGRALVGLHP